MLFFLPFIEDFLFACFFSPFSLNISFIISLNFYHNIVAYNAAVTVTVAVAVTSVDIVVVIVVTIFKLSTAKK